MSKGSSGGGDTTTTVLPPDFQVPYIQQGLRSASDLLNNPPEVYTGPGVAPLSNDTVQSFDLARNTSAMLTNTFNPALMAGFADALDTDFLNNPAYQAAAGQLRTDVMDTLEGSILPGLDTQAAALGAFGGTDYLRSQDGAIAGALDAISSGTADLMGSFYQTEAAGRNAALGTAPGIAAALTGGTDLLARSGSAQDAFRQAELTDAIQTFDRLEQAPEIALDNFIRRVYGNFGNTTTADGPGTSPLASGVGGALAGASLGSMIPAIGGPWGALIGGIGGLLF